MNKLRDDFDLRIRTAQAAHAQRLEGAKAHATQSQTFGSDAMKAPALAALGGVIALLGFYSANYSRLSESTDAMAALGEMLFLLFISLLLTVASPGFAYLSQIAYSACLHEEEHGFEHPYVRSNQWSRIYARTGDVLRWTAVLLVASSIGCLVLAGIEFLTVVT